MLNTARLAVASVAAVLLTSGVPVSAAFAHISGERSYSGTCAAVARLAGISPSTAGCCTTGSSTAPCSTNSLSSIGFSSLRGPKVAGWDVHIDYGIFSNPGDAEGGVHLGSQSTALHRVNRGVPGLVGSAVYEGLTGRAGTPTGAPPVMVGTGETEALFAVGRVFVDVTLSPNRLRTGVLRPDLPLLFKLAKQIAAPIPHS